MFERSLNKWQLVHLAVVREVGIRSGMCEEGMNLLDHSVESPCLNLYIYLLTYSMEQSPS